MFDVIIIGNGPAGLSAALYTKRAGLDTLIIGRDNGSLAKADKIENYFGFPEPVSGEELIRSGIASVKRLGVEMITDEVVNIQYTGNLLVKTKSRVFEAMCVIVATGTSRSTPKIEGLAEFEGRGVSYCAVCDGFFYRGKDVCVLGEGVYALHEAEELLPVTGSVTILTNGLKPSFNVPPYLKLRTEKVKKISGSKSVEQVEFEKGEPLKVSGVFVAVGVAGSTDLAKKVGAQIEGNKIVVDENMSTNVPACSRRGTARRVCCKYQRLFMTEQRRERRL